MTNLNFNNLFGQLFPTKRSMPSGDKPAGLYEILEYDGQLELADTAGETAIYRKRLRLRFLEDDVVAFSDHVWGDGKSLSAYICFPGVLSDIYREGDRWNVLISLRQTKHRGDIQDYYIERLIENAFTQREEWWQLEMYHEVASLDFSILFPARRPPRQAALVQRTSAESTVFEPGQFVKQPDGRQRLNWQTRSIRRFETYTISWRW